MHLFGHFSRVTIFTVCNGKIAPIVCVRRHPYGPVSLDFFRPRDSGSFDERGAAESEPAAHNEGTRLLMPPGDLKHTFHMVDELPHGASILVVDECGDIHTYVSLAGDRHENAADLSWAFTALAQCGDYERHAEAI